MRGFAELTVRRKLTSISVLSSMTALLSASVVFLLYDATTFRERMEPYREFLGEWFERPRPIDARHITKSPLERSPDEPLPPRTAEAPASLDSSTM